MSTTRRGFLKQAVVGTTIAGTACAQERRGEAASDPESALPPPDPSAGAHTVGVDTRVNGSAQHLEVGADTSVLSIVRGQLALTGCKRACGQGVCGACTMQLDGEPVTTCLLPAVHLEGRSLTTVEGLAKTPRAKAGLHPVQRAFMTHDALQCGFCTPGFVVEAAAFHDTWRAAHRGSPGAAPSREEVADALSGHLCRCGAYPSIYRAVIAACEGRHDTPPSAGAELSPRVEARAKVTGAAQFMVDVRREGMLTGKILRSPHPHARVLSIDWSAALQLPGVHGAVELTAVGNKVRFVGQEVAAIAAVDEAAAIAGLRAIRVDYERLGAAIDMDAAMAEGALPIYGAKKTRKRAPSESEGPMFGAPWRGNMRGPLHLFSHHGRRAKRRLAAAELGTGPAELGTGPGGDSGEHLFTGSFELQTQLHTALEPHGAVADWIAEDQLLVFASTQAVLHIAKDIAHRWDLDPERVEVRAPHSGGGFGAKASLSIEIAAAIDLAKVCARPVRVVNDRREELCTGGLRPGVRIELSMSAPPLGEGTPALEAVSLSNAGVAVGASNTTLMRIHLPQADLEISDYDVITNTPPGFPFRGPGGPPAFFAIEQATDALAISMGVDPIALRRSWNQNASRTRVYDWAQAQALWRDRPPAQRDKGRFRRGVGFSTASWFYFTEPATRVQVEARAGGFSAQSACQDMGNGSRTLLADVVAEVFGVAPASIDIDIGRSRGVHGPSSAGSRTASSLGPAAHDAALEVRGELLERAHTMLGLSDPKPNPDAAVGGVLGGGGEVVSWAELCGLGPTISATGRRGRDKRGFFFPAIIGGTAIGRYLSAGGQISEVEVDMRLGRVRVLQTRAGFSVGRIYSPILARSQAEGGVVQGLGLALYEQQVLDPRHGTLLSAGLEDYRVCGIGDVGEIEVEFVPGGFENVRGGGVGVGEICTLTPVATLANAVHDATGWRPMRLPLRPDWVLAGLDTIGATP